MEDSRGQIILVAALGIAVTLVALAVIVNTVIFTENLATRNTVEGQEAIMVERSSEEAVADLMAYANEYNNSTYDKVKGQFKRDVHNLRVGQNVHALTEGGMVNVSVVKINEGTTIIQNKSGPLTSGSDSNNWTMATMVKNTRWFHLRFESSGTDSTGVHIFVRKDNSKWWLNISHNSNYTIKVDPPGPDVTSKQIDATNLLINVTNGSINGNSWPALTFGEGVGKPYKIGIVRGENASATYNLTVDTKVDDAKYNSRPNTPFLSRIIYNATVNVTVIRPDLTYAGNVTVAPPRNP
ncbi:MAG: hypothetical protein ABEJ44_05290, partial [Halanaeroarchaeum sp.]